MVNEAPKFCDTTGEALNAAALALVREATSTHYIEANVPSPDSVLRDIPACDVARGTHKYVLVQLSDPAGGAKLAMRSYEGCAYHADNYQRFMRELREKYGARAIAGRVIGGGRVARDDSAKTCFVYGYSKTFGRTPGCNERSAAMIEQSVDYEGYVVTWSDDGY